MIKHLLQSCLKENKGFALWSDPNSSSISALMDEGKGEERFILAPFDLDNQKIIEFSGTVKHQVSQQEIQDLNVPMNTSVQIKNMDKKMYAQDFNCFVQELKSDSSTEKLVLARSINQELQKSPFSVFVELHQKFLGNFTYLLFDGNETFWVAATPETLVKETKSKIETMALAGTKVPDENGDIVWTPKEYEEHQLVVDYIASEFNKAGLVLNYPEKPREIKAGFVWHLQTPMIGESNGINILNLAKKIHPTPAVCGTPKENARSFILAHENLEREYYCGFVGHIAPQESHLFVNLRCAKLKDNQITIYVGGGLLKESDLENEWMETINKSKTILSIL